MARANQEHESCIHRSANRILNCTLGANEHEKIAISLEIVLATVVKANEHWLPPCWNTTVLFQHGDKCTCYTGMAQCDSLPCIQKTTTSKPTFLYYKDQCFLGFITKVIDKDCNQY